MYELEKRFCKDKGLNIKIFEEPYFSQRLALVCEVHSYENYLQMVGDFNTPQDYLEYYNSVKDTAINYIKESKAFQALNSDDMNKFAKKHNFPKCDVFKPCNIGKSFISIDMKKANFSALVHYSRTYLQEKDWFNNGTYNYEEWLSQFTDNEYIISSKYIRQVIFGNCNPKRATTYEAYLMDELLTKLLDKGLIKECDVYSAMTDEIVLYFDNVDTVKMRYELLDNYSLPISVEEFTLGKFTNTGAYAKVFSATDLEIKCASPEETPLIQRYMTGEPIAEDDLVFDYNGKLAKLLEVPEIKLNIH